MLPFTVERIKKALILKLNIARFLGCLGYKTLRMLAIGLAVLFLFYKGIAYAEAVYSFTKTMGGTAYDIGHVSSLHGTLTTYSMVYFWVITV